MSDNLPKESFYNIGVKAAIVNSNRQILVLHITRPNGVDVYWDLPGGRIIDGEAPEETLRREVEEETGITELTIERHLMMSTSKVRLPVFDTKKVGVIFSTYLCRSDSTIERPEERIAMHWLPIDEAVASLRSNPDWPEETIEKIASL